MNRSKDLRDLFRQSLINERTRPTTYNYRGNPMYGRGCVGGVHRVPGQYEHEIQFGKEYHIYFYEWSDITSPPRCFYQLESFENFLKASGIFMQLYQREIITNLGTVYITCYKGTKELNVRGSFKNLLDSMNEHEAKKLASSVQTPKLVFEPQNRWPENDGTFFG